MLKSIQGLFLLLLSIAVLAKPVLAEEQSTSKVSTEHQTLKLYKGFFPYQSCLLVSINQVLKKPNKVLLVNATVEDVYRGNYKKGYFLSVAVVDNGVTPTSFAFLSSLKNTKQIIAFNPTPKHDGSFNWLRKVSDSPICNLWIPYAGKGFQSIDIAQIKSLIKDSPTQPAQAKAAFQRFLETKWTTDRINEFCRPETQSNGGASIHTANIDTDWFGGTLHASKGTELSGKKVDWQAKVSNNVPTRYNIKVVSPDKNPTCWDLEVAEPSLEEWSAENFLVHRVGISIEQAAFADWRLNHENHPAATNYKSLFSGKSNESLSKEKTGKVTSYQCRLSNGATLAAILTADKLQSIDKILINGKLDSGWTNMYKNGLRNLAKCDKH